MLLRVPWKAEASEAVPSLAIFRTFAGTGVIWVTFYV